MSAPILNAKIQPRAPSVFLSYSHDDGAHCEPGFVHGVNEYKANLAAYRPFVSDSTKFAY